MGSPSQTGRDLWTRTIPTTGKGAGGYPVLPEELRELLHTMGGEDRTELILPPRPAATARVGVGGGGAHGVGDGGQAAGQVVVSTVEFLMIRSDFRGGVVGRVGSSVRRIADLLGVQCIDAGYEIPWGQSMSSDGVEFPADYREFIDVFGSGSIGGELYIHSPLGGRRSSWSPGGFARVISQTTREIGPMLSDMRRRDPGIFPYRMFPDPGGLLEWGKNSNGDRCFWLTGASDPDEWPVVFLVRSEILEGGWHEAGVGVAEFLVAEILNPDSVLFASSASKESWIP